MLKLSYIARSIKYMPFEIPRGFAHTSVKIADRNRKISLNPVTQ